MTVGQLLTQDDIEVSLRCHGRSPALKSQLSDTPWAAPAGSFAANDEAALTSTYAIDRWMKRCGAVPVNGMTPMIAPRGNQTELDRIPRRRRVAPHFRHPEDP